MFCQVHDERRRDTLRISFKKLARIQSGTLLRREIKRSKKCDRFFEGPVRTFGRVCAFRDFECHHFFH